MKRPPRFAIETADFDGDIARVRGAELHHLRDVMRLGCGAEVALWDGAGREYVGRIARIDRNAALVEITGAAPGARENCSITLAAAIIKGPRMDFLIEKAAELGVRALKPLACARSVVRDPGSSRIERWRRLARAAAKQSLGRLPMEIEPPATVAAAVAAMAKDTFAVACEAGAAPLGALLRRRKPRALVLACGPEGGFDDEETAAMRAAGFVAAGLGPNRMRSETAALAAAAIAADALGEIEQGS
jgi:16S rRNA (uracil1498-N3)-methyltransferase